MLITQKDLVCCLRVAFQVTLTSSESGKSTTRFWELLPGIEEFLHDLAQAFELCILSASPLSVINQVTGRRSGKLASKDTRG